MPYSTDTITRIRAARAAGRTVEDVAREFGVAKSTVSVYCRDMAAGSQAHASATAASRARGVRRRLASAPDAVPTSPTRSHRRPRAVVGTVCRHHWVLTDGAEGVFAATGHCRLCGVTRAHDGGLPPHGLDDEDDIEAFVHPWRLW